jgi:hypothetical protein
MGSRYDGEIRIDTGIDEKGFNRGIKNLGGQVKDLGMSMAVSVSRALTSFVKTVSVISLMIFAVKKLVNSIKNSVNSIIQAGQRTEALKADFDALRVSVRNAFTPLLSVALPLLQQVAQWLTKIFNIIGMVIGALTGQTKVMRATASATGDAAGGAGKLAKNTKEAEKAAKGTLAAFDEINVLDIEEPISDEDFGGGGGAGAGLGEFEMVEIDSQILGWVNKVKEFLEPLKEPLQGLWDALKGLWDAAKEAFEPWVEGLKESGIAEFLRDVLIVIIERLTERVEELTEWINNNQEAFRILTVVLAAVGVALLLILSPALAIKLLIAAIIILLIALIAYWPEVKEAAVKAWEAIRDWAIRAWENIKETWQNVKTWFVEKVWQPLVDGAANILNSIGRFFTNLWNNVTAWSANAINNVINFFVNLYNSAANIINGIGQFFANLWNNLIAGWQNFFRFIGNGFSLAFNGVISVVKGAINLIIGFINAMMSAIASGINVVINALNKLNFTVPNWVPVFGGNSWGFNITSIAAPRIPLLAQGAVIPPNSQFLAVMGDQRAGRNIETPEGLMRQIIREELESMDLGEQEITINFAGNLGALVRELRPYIEKENVRVGRSMIRGVVR